jgi:hypothetical protein
MCKRHKRTPRILEPFIFCSTRQMDREDLLEYIKELEDRVKFFEKKNPPS